MRPIRSLSSAITKRGLPLQQQQQQHTPNERANQLTESSQFTTDNSLQEFPATLSLIRPTIQQLAISQIKPSFQSTQSPLHDRHSKARSTSNFTICSVHDDQTQPNASQRSSSGIFNTSIQKKLPVSSNSVHIRKAKVISSRILKRETGKESTSPQRITFHKELTPSYYVYVQSPSKTGESSTNSNNNKLSQLLYITEKQQEKKFSTCIRSSSNVRVEGMKNQPEIDQLIVKAPADSHPNERSDKQYNNPQQISQQYYQRTTHPLNTPKSTSAINHQIPFIAQQPQLSGFPQAFRPCSVKLNRQASPPHQDSQQQRAKSRSQTPNVFDKRCESTCSNSADTSERENQSHIFQSQFDSLKTASSLIATPDLEPDVTSKLEPKIFDLNGCFRRKARQRQDCDRFKMTTSEQQSSEHLPLFRASYERTNSCEAVGRKKLPVVLSKSMQEKIQKLKQINTRSVASILKESIDLLIKAQNNNSQSHYSGSQMIEALTTDFKESQSNLNQTNRTNIVWAPIISQHLRLQTEPQTTERTTLTPRYISSVRIEQMQSRLKRRPTGDYASNA